MRSLLVLGEILNGQPRAARTSECPPPTRPSEAEGAEMVWLSLEERAENDLMGPPWPHPVIFKDRCIGCGACIAACPHDVLDRDLRTHKAFVRDLGQCLEDGACVDACPVRPKAIMIVNTTRKEKDVPTPRVPARDAASLMTDVPGLYLIGEASGSSSGIKSAASEGGIVIEHIAREMAEGRQNHDYEQH